MRRQDLTGRVIGGDFRLLRRLGRGGMSDVYLAEQISLKRSVAFKILRADLVTDETFLKRFRQEAAAAGGLNHPNIVQVYTIGEEQGVHYIAQEYVQGQTLKEYIARKGPPELPIALRIMRQVGQALQAAGNAGIIHRDIKPENILLNRKGEVKVADFGLAQLTQNADHVSLTQVGVTMGTPLYMSPEQVNGKPLDKRSDIYSFGVTSYYLLCGRPPFQGETALSVAVQHLHESPPPLAERRPDLPEALCEIVHKMMAKSREERYPDAQSVLNDLKPFARGSAGRDSQPKPARTRTGAKSSGRRASRQIGRFVGACLLVALCSAGLGWALRPANPLDQPLPQTVEQPSGGTPEELYWQAWNRGDDVEAWRAVIDSPGTNPVMRRRAHEELAKVYLSSAQLDKAEDIFDEFVRLPQDDAMKANGLAGKAIIAHARGRDDEFRLVLSQLVPHWRRLDRQMRAWMSELVAKNREKIQGRLNDEIQQLLDEPAGDAPAE